MKLVGSKMEADLQEELATIQKFISTPKSSVLLTLALNDHDTDNVVIFHCFPDEADWFITVLINNSYFVKLELRKLEGSVGKIMEQWSVKDHCIGLNQAGQIRLAIAQLMASGT